MTEEKSIWSKFKGAFATWTTPVFYRTKPGDTYVSIAREVFGDENYTRAIASANGYRRIEAGEIINLPGKDEYDGT